MEQSCMFNPVPQQKTFESATNFQNERIGTLYFISHIYFISYKLHCSIKCLLYFDKISRIILGYQFQIVFDQYVILFLTTPFHSTLPSHSIALLLILCSPQSQDIITFFYSQIFLPSLASLKQIDQCYINQEEAEVVNTLHISDNKNPKQKYFSEYAKLFYDSLYANQYYTYGQELLSDHLGLNPNYAN